MRPNVPELKGGVEGAVKIELPELPDKKDLSMTSACCCCLCSLYTLWPECCGLEMNGQVCCCNIKDACLCLRFKQNGYSTCCRHTQMMHCCDSLGAEFSICHCVSSVLLLFCANIACDCKVSCDELTCVQMGIHLLCFDIRIALPCGTKEVPTALACCGCFCYNEEEVTGLY
mmetsp:Transcript_20781/g.33473  ORF Transcript_20781/g.33473 Transcript_20781/m.33473 type:complete len:172 (+) Transcript_20781:235-750(+)